MVNMPNLRKLKIDSIVLNCVEDMIEEIIQKAHIGPDKSDASQELREKLFSYCSDTIKEKFID